MKRLALLILTILPLAVLSAASLRCRNGSVLNAELSRTAPPSSSHRFFAGKKALFAEVLVEVDPRRAISIFDYALVSDSAQYKCAAVAAEDLPYNPVLVRQSAWPSARRYRMLFLLPEHERGKSFRLKFMLFPDGRPDLPLSFRALGSRGFTPAADVPLAGMLGAPAVPEKKN